MGALREVEDQLLRRESFLLSDAGVDDPELISYVRTSLKNRLRPEPPETKQDMHFTPRHASRALRDIDAVFRSVDARMFLVSGTFLGAVRDGQFLDSDYDIDVGYFADEVDTSTIGRQVAESKEFTRAHISKTMLRVTHQNGVVLDVFGHFRQGELIWHGSTKHRWYNTPFSLTPFEFDGGEYLGPEDFDRYLTENYGNWRSPVAFWDYTFDTPNQRFPRTPGALLSLLDSATNRADRHRAEASLRALRDEFGIDFTDLIPSGGSEDLHRRLEQLSPDAFLS